MNVSVTFPLTNQELFDVGKGLPVRFPASFDEYWTLLEAAVYRVDYFDHEIIATMSYESEFHSDITTEVSHILKKIFPKSDHRFKVHNSNRPICIPDCDHAVFNPDGSVVSLPAQLYEYRPGMNAELTPVLLFEVLSKNTRAHDLADKLPCYKKIPTLRQILYLEPIRREITVYERTVNNDQWMETTLKQADAQIQVNGQFFTLGEIYGDLQ